MVGGNDIPNQRRARAVIKRREESGLEGGLKETIENKGERVLKKNRVPRGGSESQGEQEEGELLTPARAEKR